MSLISLIKNNDIDDVRDYDNIMKEINIQDKYGNSALICVSITGNIEITKLLLEVKTININSQNKHGWTSLIWASKNGRTEIVKLLLKVESINVNLQNYYGNTALIFASKYNYIEIIKLLLTNKTINVNLQNKHGWTALIWASKYNYIEIVKLLLNNGATTAVNSNYSDDMNKVLTDWKTYLPRWNRFKTYKYYPKEFKNIVMLWLLICKRKNFVNKDIKLLMIEYLAESWKFEIKI